MVEKIVFEKNEKRKTTFLYAVNVSIRNKSAYLPDIFAL